MVEFDATESMIPFREGSGLGAILFDSKQLRQADPEWFLPAKWGERARPVDSGGRGGAWFIDAPFGPSLLRLYLRGGWAARVSRDRYLWHGANRTRSFEEFRLTRALLARGLPVPRPVAASYVRDGLGYRAAILLARILDVNSFGHRVLDDAASAPWAASFSRYATSSALAATMSLPMRRCPTPWLLQKA